MGGEMGSGWSRPVLVLGRGQPGWNEDKEKSKTLGLLAFVQAGKEGKAKAGLVGWGGVGGTGRVG